MSFATANGVTLYYETHGDPAAPPLLLITGLTGYLADWWAQVPALSADFHVITFDNRSAGQSSEVAPGYTMTDMADDAAALLDALDIPRAHVFAISMGGMIAQNLALRHPHKIDRLALGCTTPGGTQAHSPANEVLAALMDTNGSGDRGQDLLDDAWFLVSEGFFAQHGAAREQMMAVARGNPQTLMGYISQASAINTHDVMQQLEQITMPTLVLHGDADLLVPTANGRLLADKIPHATLKLYPGAGHLFYIERADEVNADLRAFFRDA